MVNPHVGTRPDAAVKPNRQLSFHRSDNILERL